VVAQSPEFKSQSHQKKKKKKKEEEEKKKTSMPRRERYRDWKVFFPLAVLGLEPRVSCMLGKLCH
jgi:hypothetical protein